MGRRLSTRRSDSRGYLQSRMLQPPLALHSFLPLHSFAAVLQPPLPLQSFLPLQHAFSPLDDAAVFAAPPVDAGFELAFVSAEAEAVLDEL